MHITAARVGKVYELHAHGPEEIWTGFTCHLENFGQNSSVIAHTSKQDRGLPRLGFANKALTYGMEMGTFTMFTLPSAVFIEVLPFVNFAVTCQFR
jgi:hypothetical protein